ncbi:hypothetical protein GY652_27545, partial [Escherichia coli]|nr:hypothetical protein [Escherichia coli]
MAASRSSTRSAAPAIAWARRRVVRLRWGQLSRSVTARFVIVAFLVQLSVTGGILLFVQQSSESALAAEQKALVTDLRE